MPEVPLQTRSDEVQAGEVEPYVSLQIILWDTVAPYVRARQIALSFSAASLCGALSLRPRTACAADPGEAIWSRQTGITG